MKHMKYYLYDSTAPNYIYGGINNHWSSEVSNVTPYDTYGEALYTYNRYWNTDKYKHIKIVTENELVAYLL